MWVCHSKLTITREFGKIQGDFCGYESGILFTYFLCSYCSIQIEGSKW